MHLNDIANTCEGNTNICNMTGSHYCNKAEVLVWRVAQSGQGLAGLFHLDQNSSAFFFCLARRKMKLARVNFFRVCVFFLSFFSHMRAQHCVEPRSETDDLI